MRETTEKALVFEDFAEYSGTTDRPALGRLRQLAAADHAQRVREDWDSGRGQCDDCTCCTASAAEQ